MGVATVLVGIDAAAREAMLFAAIFFLIGGIDDLLVDVLYGMRRLGRVPRARGRGEPLRRAPAVPLAVFVAAWDESAVIGRMLRTALQRLEYPDYRLYVGTYPNDPATIEAVAAVAADDPRVRLVVGPLPGPTTKADCLNALWRALLRDETAEGWAAAAVVLHDAEDIVHPLELQVIAAHLERYAAVQIPVLPLRHPASIFVSGHYLDEFAEAHGKQMLVRQAVRAGMPLAGTGCAIRRTMLARIAEARGGLPFDSTSLTEDYELGLTLRAMGGDCVLARVPERPGGPPVAVRAYFPETVRAAVRQKARWMTGIALAGWDRTGWSRFWDMGDHWMRMRDRRATLAIPVLAVAYAALVLWGVALAGHWISASSMPAPHPMVSGLIGTNLALLSWRTLVRATFVFQLYGWAEALWSVPRIVVANYVALLAARRALALYLGILAGQAPRWDKTAHQFPDEAEAAA